MRKLRRVKKIYQQNLSGMTVNERLFETGLFDSWYESAKKRNEQEMVDILCKVEISEHQASKIVRNILEDPERYDRATQIIRF